MRTLHVNLTIRYSVEDAEEYLALPQSPMIDNDGEYDENSGLYDFTVEYQYASESEVRSLISSHAVDSVTSTEIELPDGASFNAAVDYIKNSVATRFLDEDEIQYIKEWLTDKEK